jgi:hypothetical protein
MDWSCVPESHQNRTWLAMKRTWIGFQGRFRPKVWIEFDRRQNLNWFRHRETWEPSDEFFCQSRRKSEVFLVFLILEEMSLELAFVVRLTDSWSEDEGWFRREDHVVEVRWALGCKSAETPLPGTPAVDVLLPIACHGIPGIVIQVSTSAELNDECKRHLIYIDSGSRPWSSNSLYVQSALAFCVGLIGMLLFFISIEKTIVRLQS